MSTLPPYRGLVAATGLALVGLLATACGGGPVDETAISAGGPEPTRVEFDPADFVDPMTSTNGLHPLTPGTQWVRAGTTEVGSRQVPHQVISTITDVIRTIDGVPAVAMLDQSTDAGETSQIGFDWFALDREGNVWILGGYTEDYEGGVYSNAEDAWLGAESGGDPGILVPGTVTADTARWFIGATEAGDDGSVAEPVEVGASQCVEFGCYEDVTVIREGEAGAIDNEFKYYAPGVGVILNDPRDESLHQDYFELVNLLELSPAGLAEASQVVLDLEAHAAVTSPDVYGDVEPAGRVP